MRVREAQAADDAALVDFDHGLDLKEPWAQEVAEMIDTLWPWRSSSVPEIHIEDRRVIIAEDRGTIVALLAHQLLLSEVGLPFARHRYIRLVAVHARYRRDGYAASLMEHVLTELQVAGVSTVSWLVHPANQASYLFCEATFGDIAEMTQPADEKPYLRYTLTLSE
jgi:GNAT superfamily N-acetyltransferase